LFVFLFIVIVCAPCPFKKNIVRYTNKVRKLELDEEEEKSVCIKPEKEA